MTFSSLRSTTGIRKIDSGRLRFAITFCKCGKTIFLRSGIEPTFKRRGRATQEGMTTDSLCQPNSHITCRIARSGLGLLITRIMLLIDQNQLQMTKRQEDGRTNPHHKLTTRRSFQTQITLRASLIRQTRVVSRYTRSENALHTFDELSRKCNLGHQQQHISSTRQHLGNQVNIDLRLTRPRNTMK